MAEIAQGTPYIAAYAFIYGLTLYLFRDQITNKRWLALTSRALGSNGDHGQAQERSTLLKPRERRRRRAAGGKLI
jgi:hypothetical protein